MNHDFYDINRVDTQLSAYDLLQLIIVSICFTLVALNKLDENITNHLISYDLMKCVQTSWR